VGAIKVIYETPKTLTTFSVRQTRKTVSGYAVFRVYMFEPDEELPPLPTVDATRRQCRLLSELRAQAGWGQPIVATMPPASPLRGLLPDAITIPDNVLESLPADALLRIAWGFGSTYEPPLRSKR
jgi:hypothetical protein